MPKCLVCPTDTNQVCQRCKAAHFCSFKCQKRLWRSHKHLCGQGDGLLVYPDVTQAEMRFILTEDGYTPSQIKLTEAYLEPTTAVKGTFASEILAALPEERRILLEEEISENRRKNALIVYSRIGHESFVHLRASQHRFVFYNAYKDYERAAFKLPLEFNLVASIEHEYFKYGDGEEKFATAALKQKRVEQVEQGALSVALCLRQALICATLRVRSQQMGGSDEELESLCALGLERLQKVVADTLTGFAAFRFFKICEKELNSL